MKTPQIAPTAPNEPRATIGNDGAALSPALPIPPTHRATLEAYGTANLLALLANGHTHSEIAGLLGVDPGTLGAYLMQGPDRHLYAAAYKLSAEALTDQAQAIVDSADPETVTAAQVALLKLRADHRMRRAGQRNAAYREKAPTDDGAAAAAPAAPPSFVLVVHGSAAIDGRQVATYENDDAG